MEINKLDPKKTTTGINIKMRKDNVDICAPTLMEIFNQYIKNGTFPDGLKLSPIEMGLMEEVVDMSAFLDDEDEA